VKIQSGSRSIELEGQFSDVEAILSGYWLPQDALQNDEETSAGNADPTPTQQKRASKKTRRPPAQAASTRAEKANAVDAEAVANAIKTHQLFPQIRAKVLDVPGEWINKCRVVALVSGMPITSGDVHRTMSILRVKSVLSTLSKTLSNNSSDFLTHGSNPVSYTLTSTAEQNFQGWLKAESSAGTE
jgi:hypothetical protein